MKAGQMCLNYGCNLVAGSIGWAKVMDFFYAIDADNVCTKAHGLELEIYQL